MNIIIEEMHHWSSFGTWCCVIWCVVPVVSNAHSALILGWSTCFLHCMTTKMKALWSFQMFGTAHPMTQHHIPEEFNFQQHQSENLKSQKRTLDLLRKPLFVSLHWMEECRTVLFCLFKTRLTACECHLTLILVSWQEMFHLFQRQILLWRKSIPWQKEKTSLS